MLTLICILLFYCYGAGSVIAVILINQDDVCLEGKLTDEEEIIVDRNEKAAD